MLIESSKKLGLWSLTSFALVASLCACAKFGEIEPQGDLDSQTSTVSQDPAAYFSSVVVPALKRPTACASCHALPKDGGNASFKPYQYTDMRQLLVLGPVSNARSTIDNGVMRYMLGLVPTHANGRAFCFGALTSSPCKEIREWAKHEGLTVAEPQTFSTPAPFGRIYGSQVDGAIWGWAADPDTATTPMTVEFYLDGPRGTGIDIGDTVASQPFSTVEKRGNIGFRFVLPDMYRDASPHSIYIYGLDNNTPGTVHELTGSPVQITAYLPSVAAQSYYDANVVPMLAARTCRNCHSLSEFSYPSTFYYHFLSPPPHLGGTATSSVLYRKMLGTMPHRGGSHCNGNATGGVCGALINTWNMEFE